MSANAKHAEPRERPILFSAPMILAILDNRKTVTRRLLRPGERVMEPDGGPVVYRDSRTPDAWGAAGAPRRVGCPFGVAGDWLWVRETWCDPADDRSVIYRADMSDTEIREEASVRRAHPALVRDYPDSRWRPSIFMPRWASRITLEIVDVRVERLHAITEEDARAEGVTPGKYPLETARLQFQALWQEINGHRARWETNPWCWRVEFRVMKP